MIRESSEAHFYKDDWKRLKAFAQDCYPSAQRAVVMLSRLGDKVSVTAMHFFSSHDPQAHPTQLPDSEEEALHLILRCEHFKTTFEPSAVAVEFLQRYVANFVTHFVPFTNTDKDVLEFDLSCEPPDYPDNGLYIIIVTYTDCETAYALPSFEAAQKRVLDLMLLESPNDAHLKTLIENDRYHEAVTHFHETTSVWVHILQANTEGLTTSERTKP
jgi:hypothetical protein